MVPRFSLRTTLWAFTAACVFFLVLSKGVSAWAWGVGLAVGAASVAAALVMHALFYFVFLGLGRLLGVEDVVVRTNQGGVLRSTAGQTPRADLPPRSEAAP